MANWLNPVDALTDTYANFLAYLKARDVSALQQLSSAHTSDTNIPQWAIRWNATNNNWEINTSSTGTASWSALTGTYGISISGVAPWNNVSGKPTTLSGYGITDAISQANIQNQAFTYYVAGGTTSPFTLSPSPALTSYVAGQKFSVKFTNAYSGAIPTINVSTLGAKNLVQYSYNGSLVSPNIIAGQVVDILYDGTQFIFLNPLPITAGWDFISSAQSFNNMVYVSHGLGAIPSRFLVTLVCISAENGFAIGDEIAAQGIKINFDPNAGTVSGDTTATTWVSPTQIGFGLASGGSQIIFMTHKTTGANAALTKTNWNVLFKAAH